MGWIAGVDGCRGGWAAALRDIHSGEVLSARFATLADMLASPFRPDLVAIDMPIGLMETGPRQCDLEARRLLPSRASGIFPAPIRPVLDVRDYWEANRRSRELTGKGMTRESYNIMAKIRELDAATRVAPGGLFRESWPELAFAGLNGGAALAYSKRTAEGLAERRRLLGKVYGIDLDRMEATRLSGVALDDLYDALALLETAVHIRRGEARRVPDPPPLDSFGLPMEIVYFE